MRGYASGRHAANAATSVRGPGIACAASRPIYVVEVGAFNTTTTAFATALSRFTAAGTAGTAITTRSEDDGISPVTTAFDGQSTNSTLSTGGPYVQASIGAAVGAGVIWTFGGKGLHAPGGTANGFILILPTGTDQFKDFYFVWEE